MTWSGAFCKADIHVQPWWKPKGNSASGGISSIYSPQCRGQAVRIEFIGDEIESIRHFDPVSQRSTEECVDFILTPGREILLTEEAQATALRNLKTRADELGISRAVRDRLAEKIGSHMVASVNPLFFPLFYGKDIEQDDLTAYFPNDSLLMIDDETALANAMEDLENDFSRFLMKARAEEKFYLDKESGYRDVTVAKENLQSFPQLILETLTLGVDRDTDFVLPTQIPDIRAAGRPKDHTDTGILAPLAEKIRTWQSNGHTVTMVCAGDEEQHRLGHILSDYGLDIRQETSARPFLETLQDPANYRRLVLLVGKIGSGFLCDTLRLDLITEADIFGKKIPRRQVRPAREGYFLRSFGELREGDHVVHKDHGIGLYRGLLKLAVEAVENDFLVIEYADGDKLYIPVERLDMIQRYIGPDGYTPKVERLGGSSWEAMKERVKKSIREVAEELVAIYAAREVMERNAFAPPDRLYEEFSSLFEYEETPDQARAIEDVHADMDKNKPMDRLICGDAGFGKTEVALRAGFSGA